MRKLKLTYIKGICLSFLIVASLGISSFILYSLFTWPNITIHEIVFHLKAPLEGMNPWLLERFVIYCALPILLFTILWMIFYYRCFIGMSDKNGEKILNKSKVKWYKRIWNVVTLGIFVLGIITAILAWNRLDIGTYLKNQTTYSSFIDDHYVDPSSVSIRFPDQKRNLIYIYLESLEDTFLDQSSGGAFSENLIPNLTKIALENECFRGSSDYLNGAVVMNYTTWTMGGMFAQSTGLPLILPIENNSMYSQESFFPELIGIGDLLEEAGYKNMLLMGSHAMFGGREIFYQDHGSYKMLDYDYSLVYEEIPEDYYVWWGYEDAKLFEFAKKHLLEVSKSEEPFNLTMLTVDTHYEDGYVCQDCEMLHENNPYADVFLCSDRKVGAFIEWIKQQDFYKNTTIVLVGDHLTMDSDFCMDVDAEYERKVYVSVINSAVEVENKKLEDAAMDTDTNQTRSSDEAYRYYSTMDMFPTTLASLGVTIEGERLGLGTNLFSSRPTLLELYGKDEINTQMEKASKLIEKLGETVDQEKLEEYIRSFEE